MSLAINRKIITDEIDRTGRAQATGMTPEGINGFDVINPNSPWLPAEGDMEQATATDGRGAEPEDEDQPLPQRRARPPGDRRGRAGHVE